MKKSTLTSLIIAGAAVALPVCLAAPGIASKKQKEPFWRRNFAHRGLHSADKTVPENSLAAFALAAENGYGMELDVQLSRDGEVVVFHDDDLKRVCGLDKRVDELTFAELRELRLCGTDERIPLFSEVLHVVAGRTPLIVELKNGRSNRELCRKTLSYLNAYEGEACIESFNPLIVAWFRFNAPHLLRGQLSQPPEYYAEAGFPKIGGFILGNTLLNALARPHFIAYRIGKKPLLVRLSEALGAMKIGWTSHNIVNEKGRDAVIFEFYRPDTRY